MRRSLIVFAGGGCGALLRGLLLQWLAPWGTARPLPVLLVNVLGAFLLGVIFVLADETGLLHVETRLFLAVGLLGGFTTFSTLNWGADMLFAQGAGFAGASIVYLVASAMGGVVAVITGLVAGRELIVLLERAAEGVLDGLSAHGLRRVREVQADLGSIEAEDRDEREESA